MQLWKRTFVRYVALEAPGWVLAGWLAWWLAAKAVVPPWLAALGWSLFVLKDFALYPWLRDAYAVGDPDAATLLVGRTGLARERIDPSGYVRVGAELWRAELAPGCAAVDAGASVRVRAVRGLTLIVESC
jgi:membrane protein implicated in regulation of membrane protease activity